MLLASDDIEDFYHHTDLFAFKFLSPILSIERFRWRISIFLLSLNFQRTFKNWTFCSNNRRNLDRLGNQFGRKLIHHKENSFFPIQFVSNKNKVYRLNSFDFKTKIKNSNFSLLLLFVQSFLNDSSISQMKSISLLSTNDKWFIEKKSKKDKNVQSMIVNPQRLF